MRKFLNVVYLVTIGFISNVLFSNYSQAQTVPITTNASASVNVVVGQSNYHVSEYIYFASEIGTTNFTTAATAINHLDFSVNTLGDPDSMTNYKIYLKEGTASTLATGKYNTTGYTLVFSGTYHASKLGWQGVDFTTPFVRTGSKNLQVLIERKDNVLNTGYTFDCSLVVNAAGTAYTNTSRRYNDVTAPVSGTTTLTAAVYRASIQFIHKTAFDASLTNILEPTSSCFSDPQSIGVTIANKGITDIIQSGKAKVKLFVTGANTYSDSLSNVGTLMPSDTETVFFNNINMSNIGANNVTAIVYYTGDGDHTNDTIQTSFNTASVISNFPAVETVEDSLPIFSYAQPVVGTRQLWRLFTSAYKNTDLSDTLHPHGGSKAFFFDAYSGANSTGSSAILYSNCIALPTATSGSTYNVDFWLSHDTSFSSTDDSIFVNVSTDKGITWTRVQGFGRYDANFTTAGWQEETVDLSAYAGKTIQLGFEGESSYGNIVGLDDITINVINPLPVSLINFTAQKSGLANRLNWSTSEEVNSSNYVIEKSTDSKHYNAIGQVKAAGNSRSVKTYSFVDESPAKTTNYYRLKMVDINGTFKYSVIRSVNNSGDIDIAVYPNPIQDFVNLSLTTAKATTATIEISDISGRIVYSKAVQLVEGQNLLKYNTNELRLSRGNFIIKVQTNESTTIKTINKL